MEQQRIKRKRLGIPLGIVVLLGTAILLFSMGSTGAKAVCFALIVLALFMTLIYFQLSFYREGDQRNIHRTKVLPAADTIRAPSPLKSPHHRAVWENMELTRRLMQQKEEEFYRNQKHTEKKSLGLDNEEEILFVSDRSWLFFWPVAVLSSISMIFAASPFQELPTPYSFGFLITGLLGLLLLTAAKAHTRYYLTNFRILIKREFPWSGARWAALHYPCISLLSRKRRFAWEELSIGSGEVMLCIRGLTPHKFEIVLDILRHKLPMEGNQAQT